MPELLTTAAVRAACTAQGIPAADVDQWIAELAADTLRAAAADLGDTQLDHFWDAVRWLTDRAADTAPTPTALADDPRLVEFAELWSNYTYEEVATKLQCIELDALTAILRMCGQTEAAETWEESHAFGDVDPEDLHHRPPSYWLRDALTQFVALRPNLTLHEADPESAAAGRTLITIDSTDEIFGITEITETLEDGTEELVGWEWVSRGGATSRPEGGPTTGTANAPDWGRVSEQVSRWAIGY